MEKGFLTNEKSKKRWTTLSVDLELKEDLQKVMIKMNKKMCYNSIIKKLVEEYLEKKETN